MSRSRVRQTKDSSIGERRRQPKQCKAFKTIPNFVLARRLFSFYYYLFFFFCCVGVADAVFSLSLPKKYEYLKSMRQTVQRVRARSPALLWSVRHNGFRFLDAGFDYNIRTHMPPPRANSWIKCEQYTSNYYNMFDCVLCTRTQQRQRTLFHRDGSSFRLFAAFAAMTRRQQNTTIPVCKSECQLCDRRLLVITRCHPARKLFLHTEKLDEFHYLVREDQKLRMIQAPVPCFLFNFISTCVVGIVLCDFSLNLPFVSVSAVEYIFDDFNLVCLLVKSACAQVSWH